MKKSGILFLTLKVFSVTGGIEKVCRIAGKALFEIGREWGQNLVIFSSHDAYLSCPNTYFPPESFRGFNANKVQFLWSSLRKGIQCRLVIVSHIDLLPIAFLIKLLSPQTKLLLIAHGIEVWRPLAGWKRKMLSRVDRILAVSRFTREKMKEKYALREEQFAVLNNALDPFLPPPPEQPAALRRQYGFESDDFIMLTLTRLSATEKNKGYDKVLLAHAELVKKYPRLRYVLAGKYDEEERIRLEEIIALCGLTGLVRFTGFVHDTDLAACYSMADVYIMPSEKEGFGISFIEALYYGVPVIAGNRDGTTDALCNGRLGILVDPRDQQAIIHALKKVIEYKEAFIPDHRLVMKRFGYDIYKRNLQHLLTPWLKGYGSAQVNTSVTASFAAAKRSF